MVIRAEGLHKKYHSKAGDITAVNNISLGIEPGKLTVMRGKSGSGKTTLINLLGALDYPDKGEIWFENIEITSLTSAARDMLRRKRMGFVFQSIALIGEMTAYENIEYKMRISGIRGSECDKRVAECLEMVGLSDRAKHVPAELSGGEQQRVAIARSISHRPSVVFADEPTAQLDSQMSRYIVRLFTELAEKEGMTMIMTTHDPEMVDYTHCVYTLKDGEISDEF